MLTIVLSILCAACAPGGPSAAPRQPPKLVFADTTYTFGRVEAGRPVTHSYPFRNTGGLDLSIDHVRAACSCTAAVPQPRVIPPAGDGAIDVTFDTTHEHGQVRHTVTVYSNDPVRPVSTLTLVADVDAAAAADPPQLYVGHVRRGQPAPKTVRLIGAEGTAFGPVETTGTVLDASITGATSARAPVALRVAVKPHAPLGRFTESLRVHTQNTRQPLLTIPVAGVVDPETAGRP